MTIIRAAVENLSALQAVDAQTVERLAHALNLPAVGNDFTLDTAETFLRNAISNLCDYGVIARVSDWHVHRGGHHVALSHLGATTERVLLVTERPVEDSRCWYCGDVVGNPAAHADCGIEEPPVAPNAALQAIVAGTYDQKPGDEPAAREAAERRNRVMGYLASFTDREGRLYASAYAHACDEVGEADAAAQMLIENRTFGLTVGRRQTIRKGVNFARKGGF